MVLIIFWCVLLILFSVNGNIEGVQRLEEEEREKAKEAAAGTEQEVLEGDRDPTMTGQQRRALTILRRLAFGMNRCVAKSNGEMAYQLLFEQEQLVTYRGYNMFFRYVPYAIMRCRHEDMEEVLQARPHLNGSPLDVLLLTPKERHQWWWMSLRRLLMRGVMCPESSRCT